MATERHLKDAPIKEALIYFRVVLPEQTTIKELGSGSTALEPDYPNKSEITQFNSNIQINKEQSVSTSLEKIIEGYRYTSSDDTQVVQFRLDGFTFSRLQPYLTWEEMKREAERLWLIYVATAKPTEIVRVATRYVNVMTIPLPVRPFEDILTAPPQLPAVLAEDISSFFTQIVSRNRDINATAIVTQTFNNANNNNAHITLDIDVSTDQNFLPDESKCWDYLENLRVFKNEIFFKSITEKTAELFK